jgi:DNA-binding CsgD family transcriptional regulator
MERAADERVVADVPVDEPGAGATGWRRHLPAAILVAIAALTVIDIFDDVEHGGHWLHILGEVVVVVLAGIGAAFLWWHLLAARREARVLETRLSRAEADFERFQREAQDAMKGLGAAIDRQFDRWGLSPAEREVALLLLKGLSHKDAAQLRATSERTVRQQALSVYRKAGLSGRAELAAFFLEDLLLPVRPEATATQGAPPGGVS